MSKGRSWLKNQQSPILSTSQAEYKRQFLLTSIPYLLQLSAQRRLTISAPWIRKLAQRKALFSVVQSVLQDAKIKKSYQKVTLPGFPSPIQPKDLPTLLLSRMPHLRLDQSTRTMPTMIPSPLILYLLEKFQHSYSTARASLVTASSCRIRAYWIFRPTTVR